MKESELIEERLKIGKERYGHGIQPDDDTTQWGTKRDSWLEMAQEEIIDCMIYICTDYIRERNLEYGNDANDLIIKYIENPDIMKCPFHVHTVNMLKYILSTSTLRQVT